MKIAINKLEELTLKANSFFSTTEKEILELKPSEEKWSKKEILGHLIDSAIHNLQRLTEIQYCEKPYKIRKYNPDELVKANDYQNKEFNSLVQLWLQLNNQIGFVMQNQTNFTLAYSLILPDGQPNNLKFLMTDYVDHLEHHLNQIIKQ
jgi:hypothetical protein